MNQTHSLLNANSGTLECDTSARGKLSITRHLFNV